MISGADSIEKSYAHVFEIIQLNTHTSTVWKGKTKSDRGENRKSEARILSIVDLTFWTQTHGDKNSTQGKT